MLTKEEAATYLGTSERSIERMVKAGKLAVTYQQGARKPVPLYAESDLDAVRVVSHPIAAKEATKATSDKGDSDLNDTRGAIVPVGFSSQDAFAQLVSIATAAATEAVVRATADKGDSDKNDLSPVAYKLLLSLEEASALTGLSTARLRAAIGEEKLVARKVGRAWKMRRSDVVRFVDSIFGEGAR
jgi:excisionase family DNA binding protein